MDDIEFKIKSLLGKGKNIVYYKEIDDRPRAIYFHVLRSYRKDLLTVVNSLNGNNVYKKQRSLLLRIATSIPFKVKEVETEATIERLKEIFNE